MAKSEDLREARVRFRYFINETWNKSEVYGHEVDMSDNNIIGIVRFNDGKDVRFNYDTETQEWSEQ